MTSRCDLSGQDASVFQSEDCVCVLCCVVLCCVVLCCVVLCCGSRHGEKGEVQQNSIALLVVNDLYNKCIFFFLFFFQATER